MPPAKKIEDVLQHWHLGEPSCVFRRPLHKLSQKEYSEDHNLTRRISFCYVIIKEHERLGGVTGKLDESHF